MIATRPTRLAALAAALWLTAAPAHAYFRAANGPILGQPDGTTLFSYDLRFERAGPPGAVDRLEAGNFGTLFNVVGLVPGSVAVSGPFTFTVQAEGVVPAGSTVIDEPGGPFLNITVTYTGATLTADTSFPAALSYRSTSSATRMRGFAGQVARESGPGAGGTSTLTDGVLVANVPEPSSLALAGVGLSAGFGVWMRRRLTHGVTSGGPKGTSGE